MRYKHFYEPAFTSLREKEDQALRLWSSTFRRGVSALQYKRYQAAEIYLAAAYELGVLRLECTTNNSFNVTHILQPAGRLTDLFLAQGKFATAHSFFSDMQHLLKTKAVLLTQAQEKILQDISQMLQMQRVQSTPAEKDFSVLPELMAAESRRPRRQAHNRVVLSAQGAAP